MQPPPSLHKATATRAERRLPTNPGNKREFPEWARSLEVFRCFWCRGLFVDFKNYAQHAHMCSRRPYVEPPY
ncbi:hypothetical protein H4R18_002465 [Coemansia javaensis]|uniref:Uncharacterized protein n=1 Tax=Coemansia javaensis TaxID=2761396 RepID=A0A9W8HBZ9_9FUNG|nr:hypothetical protein H4R18_002465 [Coemansia javaensis]